MIAKPIIPVYLSLSVIILYHTMIANINIYVYIIFGIGPLTWEIREEKVCQCTNSKGYSIFVPVCLYQSVSLSVSVSTLVLCKIHDHYKATYQSSIFQIIGSDTMLEVLNISCPITLNNYC